MLRIMTTKCTLQVRGKSKKDRIWDFSFVLSKTLCVHSIKIVPGNGKQGMREELKVNIIFVSAERRVSV